MGFFFVYLQRGSWLLAASKEEIKRNNMYKKKIEVIGQQ